MLRIGLKSGVMIGRATDGRLARRLVLAQQRNTRVNGTMMVCGVAAGSSPNLKQQSNENVKLMIDCGSQRTDCCVDFAKDYDSERAKLWDIQDQKVEAHGKKIVDVMFHGQTKEGLNVARNVASMGRADC